MRNAFSLLALSATVAAQEPPVLTTFPPVTSPTFNATALGGGVTEVAQITFLNKFGASPAEWYITATVKTPASAFYTGYTGRAVSTGPGTYTVTSLSAGSTGELANLPAPTTDYFAFNASYDKLVMVYDTGAATPPAVMVRANTTVPFQLYGSIGAPVPATYDDSQIGNGLLPGGAAWNGTNSGRFEFVYISGQNIFKVPVTLTGAVGSGTVTLGTPVQITSPAPAIARHSPSALRQSTGLPSDAGLCRAFIHSRNDSSADSFFHSTLADTTVVATPELLIFDDASWKANPGHIGGSLYWAYATTVYGNEMQEDVVAMSSVVLPLAGGADTIVCWAPPSAAPQLGFVMLGALLSPGLNLSPIIARGNLGLNPAALVFLPTQAFDRVLGEMSYTLVFPGMPGPRQIDMQVGCLNLGTNQIFLGNNAAIYWR